MADEHRFDNNKLYILSGDELNQLLKVAHNLGADCASPYTAADEIEVLIGGAVELSDNLVGCYGRPFGTGKTGHGE